MGRPTLEVAGWRRYRWLKPSWQMRSGDKRLGRTEAGSHSHSPATALVVGAFFFFLSGFAFRKNTQSNSQLPVHIWVAWLRQDADRNHTWSC